jgi:actin-related protein
MILESISRADVDIKRELFANIVLTGGTTMLKNFSERLQKILPDVAP